MDFKAELINACNIIIDLTDQSDYISEDTLDEIKNNFEAIRCRAQMATQKTEDDYINDMLKATATIIPNETNTLETLEEILLNIFYKPKVTRQKNLMTQIIFKDYICLILPIKKQKHKK